MIQGILQEEHNIFRQSVRTFLEKEVKPYLDAWRKNRQIPRRNMAPDGGARIHWLLAG